MIVARHIVGCLEEIQHREVPSRRVRWLIRFDDVRERERVKQREIGCS